MSYEQKTRQKPNLPSKHYTVVHRLRNFDDDPLKARHALFLGDAIEKSGLTTIISDEDGALYVRSMANCADGLELVERSTTLLWRGISRLALHKVEVEARIVPSAELDNGRPLAVSFDYLDDVTPEARAILESASQSPVETSDLDLEFDWLL